MRIQLESARGIGRKIGLNGDKGYGVAVFLALIIVSAITIGYYAYYQFNAKPEGYSTIHLLDAQKQAVEYPEVLVANQNSTFNVYVSVENHMGEASQYQVLMKITDNLSTFPVNVPANEFFEVNLGNDESWEKQVTVSQNQVGSYSVVFELWRLGDSGTYEFTHNFCVLKIQVIRDI